MGTVHGTNDDFLLHEPGLSFWSESVKAFEATALYSSVYTYVHEYMSRYDPSHDFSHILRVVNLAKDILYQESQPGRASGFNAEAVILSAFLHDVGDHKYATDGETAGQVISQLLSAHGAASSLITKVTTVVENVSFSKEVKDPQKVQDIIRAHPELAIVQDADRLDALGATGVGRAFAYGAAKAPDRGLQGTIGHFAEKLEKLEGMMKTTTGRRLARERTQRLLIFREWWEEERELPP